MPQAILFLLKITNYDNISSQIFCAQSQAFSFIILEEYIVGDYDTDKTSQNELFDQLDDTVLDFTESNPFGDVGSAT